MVTGAIERCSTLRRRVEGGKSGAHALARFAL
jgi:hypothetical protein